MVGEIHDDALGGTGFGISVRGFGGILLLSVSRLGLAGQFAVVGYEGVQGGVRLEGVSLQDVSTWRAFWMTSLEFWHGSEVSGRSLSHYKNSKATFLM